MSFVWTNKAPIKDIAADMVRRVAFEIERDTKLRTPVDTGNLRRSYTTSYMEAGEPEAWVGTNVNYAQFVEFGTKYQQAQPHLGPALEKARAKYS